MLANSPLEGQADVIVKAPGVAHFAVVAASADDDGEMDINETKVEVVAAVRPVDKYNQLASDVMDERC